MKDGCDCVVPSVRGGNGGGMSLSAGVACGRCAGMSPAVRVVRGGVPVFTRLPAGLWVSPACPHVLGVTWGYHVSVSPLG